METQPSGNIHCTEVNNQIGNVKRLFKFIKFPPIESDGIIPTEPFFEASKSLVDFVTILGPVFIPVRSDISGNIDKLSKIWVKDKEQFVTINAIIVSEIGLPEKKQIGTDALLWLTRALQYMNTFIQLMVADYDEIVQSNQLDDNLTPHFTQAYETTLRQHHNWLVQNVVSLSLRAAPSRSSLINLFSPEINSTNEIDSKQIKEKQLYDEMNDYRQLVEDNIKAVHRLYDQHGIKY